LAVANLLLSPAVVGLSPGVKRPKSADTCPGRAESLSPLRLTSGAKFKAIEKGTPAAENGAIDCSIDNGCHQQFAGRGIRESPDVQSRPSQSNRCFEFSPEKGPRVGVVGVGIDGRHWPGMHGSSNLEADSTPVQLLPDPPPQPQPPTTPRLPEMVTAKFDVDACS
jgi:hypothetical protein